MPIPAERDGFHPDLPSDCTWIMNSGSTLAIANIGKKELFKLNNFNEESVIFKNLGEESRFLLENQLIFLFEMNIKRTKEY